MRLVFLACIIGTALASVLPIVPSNQVPWNEPDDTYRRSYSEKTTTYLNGFPFAVEEDANLKFVDLVKKYGYPAEAHTVQTRDGYLLTLHRIPHGKNGPPTNPKGVVFVQHGLLSSSIDWVIPGPEKGIGYLLADKGYDVWLGNARGNSYSKNHTNMDISTKDFWDFSWHEIGTIDLPAMIDYALAATGEKQLFYIGHSQGTTAFYVMTSLKEEYNDKIRAQFSLAPIAYVNHLTSPLIKIIAAIDGILDPILELIGMHEFLPTDGFLHSVTQKFCDSWFQGLCENTLFVICGFNDKQFNATLLPIIMGHTPAGASTKQLLHYGQLINTGGLLSKGKFRQYDYGYFGNKEKYGTSSPPKYNLEKITAPVYLFYSHNDWLAAEKDVRRLYDELGNVQGRFLIPDEDFNHLDYVFGIDAVTLVYEKVFGLMLRH